MGHKPFRVGGLRVRESICPDCGTGCRWKASPAMVACPGCGLLGDVKSPRLVEWRGEMKTTAEVIAERYDNDGQCWIQELGEGRIYRFLDTVRGQAEIVSYGDRCERYEFGDGSAIIVTEGGWWVEGDEPS